MHRALSKLLLLAASATLLPAASPLTFYFVDGGAADATTVLVVTPAGQSLLLDVGYPYNLERVLGVLKTAGVAKLDYVVITHYHHDHASALPKLVGAVPIANIVDHGPSAEAGKTPAWWKEHRWETFVNREFRDDMNETMDALYTAHVEARAASRHIIAKAGDRIPLRGVDVQILSSAGQVIASPVEGGGAQNPACAQTEVRTADDGEDQNSIGLLMTFGKFRFIHLAARGNSQISSQKHVTSEMF